MSLTPHEQGSSADCRRSLIPERSRRAFAAGSGIVTPSMSLTPHEQGSSADLSEVGLIPDRSRRAFLRKSAVTGIGGVAIGALAALERPAVASAQAASSSASGGTV